MLSIEMVSSMEPAVFQSWLTDSIFHTQLSMEIMQKPFSESFLSLWPSAEIITTGILHHCGPQPNFSMTACSPPLPLKPDFVMMRWFMSSGLVIYQYSQFFSYPTVPSNKSECTCCWTKINIKVLGIR